MRDNLAKVDTITEFLITLYKMDISSMRILGEVLERYYGYTD